MYKSVSSENRCNEIAHEVELYGYDIVYLFWNYVIELMLEKEYPFYSLKVIKCK